MNLSKIKLETIYFIKKYFNAQKMDLSSENKRAFLMLTPSHGNLGDQAIALSEIRYLEENYPDFEIHEITLIDFSKKIRSIEKKIRKNDIVFIHGGGNLGDIYYIEEMHRRKLIKTFTKNKIYSFPQSLAFKRGSKEVKRSKKIYSQHPDLHMIIRETNSFDKSKEIFLSNQLSFFPDIVLYNSVTQSDTKRSGAIFLLRDDTEKITNDILINQVSNALINNNISIELSDTHLGIDNSLTYDNRFDILNKKIEEISNYGLVVTDRLHGMILAYITGTPCIAFNNSTGKVFSTYNDWLKESDAIKILDSSEVDIHGIEDIVLNIYKKKGSDLKINKKFEGMFK